jgi:hypothetical protein
MIKKKLTLNSVISKRPRKAAFLPDDEKYLNTHKRITLGEHIGTGGYGGVYSVKNNPNLVVKIPVACTDGYCKNIRKDGWCYSKNDIMDEGNFCEDHNTNSKSLFIPTKVVKMKKCNNDIGYCIGLVRPRIKELTMRDNIPLSQLVTLRKQLIDLSKQGFVFADDLQVGVDQAGRILQFDLNSVNKDTVSNALYYNNTAWRKLLHSLGILQQRTESMSKWNKKYAWIDPNWEA